MPTPTQSIFEIVTTQPSAAAVLQYFDIDLCLHAKESLHQACAKLQLSVDQVLDKLAVAEADAGAPPIDPASLSPSRLIQHIVRVHHQRVRRELPRLNAMAHKLAAKSGRCAPELKKIEALLEELQAEMFSHIEKEEQILFPFIAQMDEYLPGSCSPTQACFRSVAQPIAMMEREHESANHTVAQIRSLTHGFKPPVWACTTHIAFFSGLRAFEIDLTQHVHLENDVLFPRAIALEAELNRRG
jgi:regulator of cell morphogenesis and NO signaling